jgi:hypothetical protein
LVLELEGKISVDEKEDIISKIEIITSKFFHGIKQELNEIIQNHN